MEYQDLGSLVIVGAVVSLFVQIVKAKLGTSGIGTMLAVLLFALGAGALYVLTRETAYFETVVQIVLAAGAMYTFVISKFESK